MEHFAGWSLATLVSAFIGSYLSSYLRTKAHNLATHEDLDKLVVQMEATTSATKAIEARITAEVWNKQRQWELKRDAVLELMQALGRANESLQMLGGMASNEQESADDRWTTYMHPQLMKWRETSDAFDHRRFTAKFLCSEEFGQALDDLAAHMNSAAAIGVSRKVFSRSEVFFPIQLEIKSVMAKARRELGIEPTSSAER